MLKIKEIFYINYRMMKICINDTKYKSLRRIQETILSICKKENDVNILKYIIIKELIMQKIVEKNKII